MIKQVIVMRNDLNMRKGKMIAQGAHASIKVLTDICYANPDIRTELGDEETENKLSNIDEWLEGLFTKIVVYVNSEKELDDIYKIAKFLNMNCSMVVDVGLTEFHGVETKTCCAIGPDDSEKIDEITGHLPLL